MVKEDLELRGRFEKLIAHIKEVEGSEKDDLLDTLRTDFVTLKEKMPRKDRDEIEKQVREFAIVNEKDKEELFPRKKKFKDMFKPKKSSSQPQFMNRLELKKKKLDSRKKLRDALEKGGIELPPAKVKQRLYTTVVIITLLLYGYLFFRFIRAGTDWFIVVLWSLLIWTVGFAIMMFLGWVLLYTVFDVYKYNRRSEIERVLPDYLQLTAANIRAGMPIDRALWFAVRPRFGILANEIEMVAKRVMSGEELDAALTEFTEKYDSATLKRSVSLLIEGIKGGGEIGNLLTRIANNIQESFLLKKEMAANVVTYVIFISFATVGAAPFLFALSSQLLQVIGKITAEVQIPETGGGAFAALSFSSVGITQSDFRIFAFVTLFLTSLMSSIIIATIRKGSPKGGVKYIPAFVLITTMLYLIADFALSKMLANIF